MPAKLEDLKSGALVKGVLPGDRQVSIINVQWHGNDVVDVTYRDEDGRTESELVFREREIDLEVVAPGVVWKFDADGHLFRLASEAYRIRMAHLFDPHLAVHTSVVDPLPHQITAVYEEMLPRQPLRFLLADDPGAGKTIMTGLFIKELIARGDLRRCLICCPGSLADQWQDELWNRFQLSFEIITRESFETARSGNPYIEKNLVISRMDQMSRSEDIQAKLKLADWDLVVVDEAHKMSAHYFGNELKKTKRFKLGELIGHPERTRHFLLLTATPHSGKEDDFQLFMSLIDGDRFEGRFREGVHGADGHDLMRRMVKEDLVKFDGTPLFPERRAYTVAYKLSDLEAKLYHQVTEYVRDEMNRAERLQDDQGRRFNRVGFALTTLQRRLASSPEAILRSITRRRERLEKRLREEKLLKRGRDLLAEEPRLPDITDEQIEDLEDAPEEEVEEFENELVEQASAASTIAELEAEIETLQSLTLVARQVRNSGTDKKWEELSNLIQNTPEMRDKDGHYRKMIIFTEHRDTLNYLVDRIGTLTGKPESVVTISGGMTRERRRTVQEAFTQDKTVQFLVATDAAGEGINLQRAHLMINYDLPWNPNRLEQRFGRIHRIGQTEVCHMWSLVAVETREGDVFKRLLTKIETEQAALKGRVFDVLGRMFEGQELRKLLINAIRYGEKPEVQAMLQKVVDEAFDPEHIKQLIQERSLMENPLGIAHVQEIREDMERAEARKLQPHFIRSFFLEAFRHLGGQLREREPRRFEVTRVPNAIRQRDLLVGLGEPVLARYERICFDKELVNPPKQPLAAFVCPGHALLDGTIDVILEKYRGLLRQGTVLLDRNDYSEDLRALYYLEHTLQDARILADGQRRVVSKRMQFVEIDATGNLANAGYAPHLDYEPLDDAGKAALKAALQADWLRADLETQIKDYAIKHLVSSHLKEVKQQKDALIAKAEAAVRDRLTKEINLWDDIANKMKEQQSMGKATKIKWQRARERADELQARLAQRLDELAKERQISPLPPNIIGGALVVPIGLLAKAKGEAVEPGLFGKDRDRIEAMAMAAVMEYERSLGRTPRDVSKENLGYDVESKLEPGKLLLIEVKGRAKGADTVTVTRNEIIACLNKPEDFRLAIVSVDGDQTEGPAYIQEPFTKEPDFAVTSVNYNIKQLLAMAKEPV